MATRSAVFAVLGGISLLFTGTACQSASAGVIKTSPIVPRAGEVVSLDDVVPHFVPGETMTWELTIAGLEAGRARFAAGSPGEEEPTVALQAQAEASGLVAVVRDVRDDAQSLVDRVTGLPVRTEAEAAWAGKVQRVVSTRVPGADSVLQEVMRREKTGAERLSKRTQKLPAAETHDALSAILVLRGWNAPTGTRGVLFSIGGTRLWRTELVIEGTEVIESELGPRRCVRIAGTAFRVSTALVDDNKKPPRHFTFWRSDDEERIPLRVSADTEYGKVMIDLTSYAAPAQ